ncbi:hypothetical protein PPERSA_01704 [Pseudocohnilembus persalinus]|uniref:Uncharacterized protein n=1 Tax=Pseudocohnilembus persalinus TaxID=266149 RepID=A0A0V0R0T0_PSEPJ|nr:hypothetical protein PPERSA_01704 [Pseudocohnilembus persalinus]|eukprot:KRX08159.1 hypothetical protein PPERSA_01704 [Pseudocohnilembus persalinus]
MKSRTDKLGEIKEADRDIKKQVDLSADKIIHSLYQRLSLETQQESMRKLVKFYEKQTTIFQTKLHQNIREIEVYMANKTNTIRLLRTENHTHIQRIRKLDDQIENLQKELKAGPKKPANNNLGASIMNMSSNQSITSPLRSSKIGSDQENRSMLIDKIMVQKNFENSKKDAIQSAKQQKIDLMEKINNNSEQIYIQEEQLGEKKKKFKDLERAQKLFYFELLKIGKDTRNKGLVWIILYLKKQGEKVKLEQLPDFLDQKAREFIFQKTSKIMELQEMVSIQEMQIDVYKQSLRNQINVQAQNQSIQSPQKTFFNSKNDWTSILDQQASILLDAAMANPSNNNNKNNLNNQNNNTISFNNNNNNNIQNHQSSIINTMIEQANQVEQQNFSIINVSQVKLSQIHQAKQNQVQEYRSMISTLSNREKEVVDETLNQLFYPKTTSSDVFYDETKKKMRQTFRIQKQVQVPKPTNLQEEDEFSDYSDSMEQVQDLVENLQETKGEQMQHNIVLYDNDQQMNNYETKEEFFQAHRKLNVKIQNKKKEIKTLEDQELSRIVKEFDYKNYLQKYHTKYSTVLCALFGVTRAEREIVKNGLKEK